MKCLQNANNLLFNSNHGVKDSVRYPVRYLSFELFSVSVGSVSGNYFINYLILRLWMIRMKKLVLRDSDSSLEVQTIDLKGAIPSLKDAQELPVDLCGNYWTQRIPENLKGDIFRN